MCAADDKCADLNQRCPAWRALTTTRLSLRILVSLTLLYMRTRKNNANKSRAINK